MSVASGDFIKLSYTGRLENGDVFDTTDPEVAKQNDIYAEGVDYAPVIIVVGENMLLKGLDEDLVGKDVGYEGTVTVPPDKAFGQRNPALIEVVPTRRFEKKPVPGMRVTLDNRTGTVENVIGGRVRVDFNSPYAGKTITYHYTIHEIIATPVEKIRGLFKYYLNKDFKVSIRGHVVKVNMPYEFAFNQTVQYYKSILAEKIMQFVDATEVDYIEVHKKSQPAEESTVEESEERAEGAKSKPEVEAAANTTAQ